MADEKKTPAPVESVSGKSPDAGKHDPNAPAQEKTDTPEKPEGSPVAETPKPSEERSRKINPKRMYQTRTGLRSLSLSKKSVN